MASSPTSPCTTCVPTDPPDGYTPTGSPRWRNEGGPWKANVTVHVIAGAEPVHHVDGIRLRRRQRRTQTRTTPKNTDAPDALQYKLLNAPPGATVDGAVYWQVYRALVTNVVLLNPQTGTHLAQWNIWQPGAPLP